MKGYLYFSLLGMLCLSACQYSMPDSVQVAYDVLPDQVDYNYHIRPILSDKCFSCHGPDANTRLGKLRLDIESEAMSALENGHGKAIVPGSTSRSLMIERIFSEDTELQMPPAEANLILSEREKALIYKWIKDGAEYKEHWAFTAPENLQYRYWREVRRIIT